MALDPEIQNPDGTIKPGKTLNPSGRPNRKDWEKQLKIKFPINNLSNMLIAIMAGIPPKPKDLRALLKTIEDKEARKDVRKYLKNLKGHTDFRTGQSDSIATRDIVSLIQWLIEHTFGRPTQHQIQDVNADITNRNIDLNVNFVESDENGT